jgi:allophanate hydrolase subunit 2
MRRFGVPPGGPIDPYTPHLVRASLLLEPDAPIIEVMGTIVFEARTPITVTWMTPQGGFVKNLGKWESCRITCMGSFAGYLGFTHRVLPERKLKGLFDPISQFRYVPCDYRLPFDARSTLDMSRMGFRMDCTLDANYEQGPSEPACPGLIQQTPSGQIIVLGPEGPVTGGYRKLGTVIQADYPYLAMITSQQHYEFIPVDLDIARQARQEVEQAVTVRSKFLRIMQERELGIKSKAV